jgi:hypothetical protein
MGSTTKSKALMWMALTGAFAVWRIYDMMTATETPSAALRTLEWAILIALVVGFVGNAIAYSKAQS